MGSLLPTLRSRPAAAAPVPVPVEGLGPAEGRADFSEDFWRGWVADLSDAELATLHAIVEEQQAKKGVPKAKAKAAPTLAELDEWGNRPTEEKRRLMQEARREMEGNRASASAVADAIVYIPATGAKFHSRSRCGNMRTAQPVTLACAEARGYTRCGSCW